MEKVLFVCAALVAVSLAGCVARTATVKTADGAVYTQTAEGRNDGEFAKIQQAQAYGIQTAANDHAAKTGAQVRYLDATTDGVRAQTEVGYESGMARVDTLRVCNRFMRRARHMKGYLAYRCERAADQSFVLEFASRSGGAWLPVLSPIGYAETVGASAAWDTTIAMGGAMGGQGFGPSTAWQHQVDTELANVSNRQRTVEKVVIAHERTGRK